VSYFGGDVLKPSNPVWIGDGEGGQAAKPVSEVGAVGLEGVAHPGGGLTVESEGNFSTSG
jgi:hypothetical protein